jgi:hypothetical protein
MGAGNAAEFDFSMRFNALHAIQKVSKAFARATDDLPYC